MNPDTLPSNFDFTISYASSERAAAIDLANSLSSRGAVVFIDEFYRSHLLGKRLDLEFEWVFGPGTKYFIPIISRSYVDKLWTQHEWSSAIKEAANRKEEFILPLRVDDSLIMGLPSTVGYLDLRQHSIEEVAEILIQKISRDSTAKAGRWVATFGLLIEDVLNSSELPTEAPKHEPQIYDWLAKDLLTRLGKSSFSNMGITEDSRDGETFSVRIAFIWNPQEQPLDFGTLGWWDILEVLPLDEVYGSKT